MITPPAEPPQWGQCVLTVEQHLDKPERKALRFAMRKVNRVTGLRFRFVRQGGQINVSYSETPARMVGWTAVQGDPIFWAGVSVDKSYLSNRQERRHVMMHELAHAIGVEHNWDDPGSVMWAWANGSTRWGKADRRALRAVTVGCR